MSVLVDDLLLLAHLDEGRPLEREPVALDDVVAEAVETAQTLEPERPIEVDARRRASCSATATGSARSIDNLLANVRSHTPPEAPARSHARAATTDDAVLAVADSGPGMDAEQRRARLRALLPRRPLARPRERRRGPRPRDRRRRRRGARRPRLGRVGARRGSDLPRRAPARDQGRDSESGTGGLPGRLSASGRAIDELTPGARGALDEAA